jgi:hypothetical protein
MARAPAGSMAPGTVARAALALGAADTGRVAPPRPLAELVGTEAELPAGAAGPLELGVTEELEPGVTGEPAGLLGAAGELPGLVGAAAVPPEGPETGAEPDTEARPLVEPLTARPLAESPAGTALTGAEPTEAEPTELDPTEVDPTEAEPAE